MPALTPAGLSRSTTDRLLDGGTGPEPLEHLLAAAAAPPQADELSGEHAARQAFIAAAGFRPLLAVAPNSPRRRTRALSWIVAAKAITAVALTAGAGGVALAATSGSLPDGLPDVSTQQRSDPGPATARPTVVVDRARGTAQRPDSEPAPASSAGSPDARRDSAGPGESSTGTVPPARSAQPGRPETEPAPDDGTPAAHPRSLPATRSTPPDRRTTTRNRPPRRRLASRRRRRTTAPRRRTEKDHPGNSDHVGDQRSDTAKRAESAGMSGQSTVQDPPIRPGPGDFPLSWNSAQLRPGVRLVSVAGELDILTAPLLLSALQRPENIGATHLVISLVEVDFLAGAGINVMIDVARRRRRRTAPI